ncbi:hypothetical protein [Rhizobium binxianense]|uniref:hypothetical protein n=1 Tax=Rhizobium binxianense TaxID=3024242 RepID=UPI0023A9A465|nr:hypothetical protein [Rhizobium sp. MJ22]WEA24044.1 hypothetical protein PO862_13085 [Rhizobium sp. MJ22]
MNLRVLKKLSKRAAGYLSKMGDTRQQFPSERGDNYHGWLVTDRKHWDRRRTHLKFEPRNEYRDRRGAEILHRTRSGKPLLISPPTHPRKGTVMVGCTSGYYEPEWDEECAWRALDNLVRGHFTDWEKMEEESLPFGGALMRDLSTPSLMFKAADEMLRELSTTKTN